MNDNYSPETARAMNDARAAVDQLIEVHEAATVPTVIAAVIEWSIEHGAAGLIKSSLANALAVIPQAEAAWQGGRQ